MLLFPIRAFVSCSSPRLQTAGHGPIKVTRNTSKPSQPAFPISCSFVIYDLVQGGKGEGGTIPPHILSRLRPGGPEECPLPSPLFYSAAHGPHRAAEAGEAQSKRLLPEAAAGSPAHCSLNFLPRTLTKLAPTFEVTTPGCSGPEKAYLLPRLSTKQVTNQVFTLPW